MFGESLLVAPITEAINNTTGMVEKKIWIPEVGSMCLLCVFYQLGIFSVYIYVHMYQYDPVYCCTILTFCIRTKG